MAYVYLIRAHNSGGLHKIGKTLNLERRMRELKAGSGAQVKVIQLSDEKWMHRVEQALHREFRHCRIPQSEMFNMTDEELETCCARMEYLTLNWRYQVDPEEQKRLAEERAELRRIRERTRELLAEKARLKKALREAREEKRRAKYVDNLNRMLPWVVGIPIGLAVVTSSAAALLWMVPLFFGAVVTASWNTSEDE